MVTNPDMLHSAILPHHTKWFQLFEQLRYIVIDELHTYRGVFGSHVANVLRRLLRICAHYGSHPVIVCCSATIGNPGELAETLTGRPVRLIDRNGAPAGERHVLLVDPPLLDARDGRARLGRDPRPALGPAVPAGRPPDDRVRTVAGRRRAAADRPARVAPRELRAAEPGPRLPRRLPADRAARDRARPARRRDPRASSPPTRSSSASTSVGWTRRSWPATRARSPRRGSRSGGPGGGAGRASRSSSPRRAPVDQYVVHHPEFLLEGTPEEARLDPDNLHVLLGPPAGGDLRAAVRARRDVRAGSARTTCSRSSPRRATSARPTTGAGTGRARTSRPRRSRCGRRRRRTSSSSTRRPDRPRVIGEVDLFAAQMLVHEDAIYLHESVQYHVDRLDWDERKAYVRRIDVDHYTQADRAVTLKPLDVFAEAPATGGRRRPRRGDGRQPRHALQEAEVRDQREPRLGPDPPARDRAPDDGLLADRRRASATAGGGTSWTSRCSAPAGRSRPSPRAADGRPARPRPGRPRSARPHAEEPTIYLYEAVPGRRRPVRAAVGAARRAHRRRPRTSSRRAAARPAARPAPGPRLEPDVDARALACACWPSWAPRHAAASAP